MYRVTLPISKSIANRLLMLQSLYGDPLMEVSDKDISDDVVLLHHTLLTLQQIRRYHMVQEIRFNLHNCGTAMRFLTAYCATLNGLTVILDGSERMYRRPIGQEVEALCTLGADITYLGSHGFPPLRISGKPLNHKKVRLGVYTEKNEFDVGLQSSQFVSALLLAGIEVETDDPSPYITMTRRIREQYIHTSAEERHILTGTLLERDWSSAAFWYEYVALHGSCLLLQDLHPSSLQGDMAVVQAFESLGVKTEYTEDGTLICAASRPQTAHYTFDFAACPDLYPAAAITCEQLGISLTATGTERLALKESNRLLSVRQHRTHHDHRIAMALLAADLPCDDTQCISKSYPTFTEQLAAIRLR